MKHTLGKVLNTTLRIIKSFMLQGVHATATKYLNSVQKGFVSKAAGHQHTKLSLNLA